MSNNTKLLKAIRIRTHRTERTPYYMVDLPPTAVRYFKHLRSLFIETFGRDYEDEDPMFWDTARRDKILPAPNLDAFIESLCSAMKEANHHPAQVFAVSTTGRVIYGCGTCIDQCGECNFREVPNGWTEQWKTATQAYEKWAPGGGLYTPPVVPGIPTA